MKRQHWLALTVLVLLLGNIAWYVWSHWGLITIHSENQPLSDVIRSIEKQGHVTLRTDLDTSKPVRMYVDKVNLAEAIETLSTLTDSRWRLTYVLAPDQAGIDAAVGNFASGKRLEDWKMIFVPAPNMLLGEPYLLPDPRKDPWEVKPAAEPKLQAYLEQASRTVSASFLFPKDWNPDVSAPPKGGPISKALPRLAKAANGHFQEVFVLRQGDRRGPGPEGEDGPRRQPSDEDRDRFRTSFEERIQAEINKLPPSERATAQQEHNERKQFFQDIQTLPPEEKAAKMREFFTNDANMDRREKADAAADGRRSPQQRLQRAHDYLGRKAAAKSAAGNP